MKRSLLALSCLLGIVATAPPAVGQMSRCADCHVANAAAPGHVTEWGRSPHARGKVGCEACHGGDPSTFESTWAHRGILSPADKASPVHRRNLPATCGNCHEGPYLAFQRSRHSQLLATGGEDVPTCATCHGEVAAELLSPKRLEARCAGCHGPDKAHARPGFGAQARQMLEGVRDVRADLREAGRLIARVPDAGLRGELERERGLAEAPLVDAIYSGHSFVFDRLQERLTQAQQRTEALLGRVSSAPGRR